MKWFETIVLIVLIIATINLLIIAFSHQNLFSQALYAFIYDHKIWKRYRRLKKYLQTNPIPIINLLDYEGNDSDFAFIQYDNMIFVTQGRDIYLSSYYNHLIKNLLKQNNHDS